MQEKWEQAMLLRSLIKLGISVFLFEAFVGLSPVYSSGKAQWGEFETESNFLKEYYYALHQMDFILNLTEQTSKKVNAAGEELSESTRSLSLAQSGLQKNLTQLKTRFNEHSKLKLRSEELAQLGSELQDLSRKANDYQLAIEQRQYVLDKVETSLTWPYESSQFWSERGRSKDEEEELTFARNKVFEHLKETFESDGKSSLDLARSFEIIESEVSSLSLFTAKAEKISDQLPRDLREMTSLLDQRSQQIVAHIQKSKEATGIKAIVEKVFFKKERESLTSASNELGKIEEFRTRLSAKLLQEIESGYERLKAAAESQRQLLQETEGLGLALNPVEACVLRENRAELEAELRKAWRSNILLKDDSHQVAQNFDSYDQSTEGLQDQIIKSSQTTLARDSALNALHVQATLQQYALEFQQNFERAKVFVESELREGRYADAALVLQVIRTQVRYFQQLPFSQRTPGLQALMVDATNFILDSEAKIGSDENANQVVSEFRSKFDTEIKLVCVSPSLVHIERGMTE